MARYQVAFRLPGDRSNRFLDVDASDVDDAYTRGREILSGRYPSASIQGSVLMIAGPTNCACHCHDERTLAANIHCVVCHKA